MKNLAKMFFFLNYALKNGLANHIRDFECGIKAERKIKPIKNIEVILFLLELIMS